MSNEWKIYTVLEKMSRGWRKVLGWNIVELSII